MSEVNRSASGGSGAISRHRKAGKLRDSPLRRKTHGDRRSRAEAAGTCPAAQSRMNCGMIAVN